MKLVNLLKDGETTEACPFAKFGAGQGWFASKPAITGLVASAGSKLSVRSAAGVRNACYGHNPNWLLPGPS